MTVSTTAIRAIVAAGLALALLPAAAQAAQVGVVGSALIYVADDPREANDVTIQRSADGQVFTVTDAGSLEGEPIPLTSNGTCSTAGNQATCPAGGVTAIEVHVLDRDDAVRIAAPIAARVVGGPGSDVLTGGTAADEIFGGSATDADSAPAADVLNGGPGNDRLVGEGGPDVLNGEDGDDSLRGGEGADALNGGPGRDLADWSERTAPVVVTLDGAPGDGQQGEGDNVATDVEDAAGGLGADTLTGNPGPNTLAGNGGNDILDGGAGPDRLGGGDGIDLVTYASRTAPVRATLDGRADDGEPGEADTLGGDVENLTGGAGADLLAGGPAANVLLGGAGADRLAGGRGRDTLDGGDGNDSFQTAGDRTVDRVVCGAGRDGAVADRADRASRCERIERRPLALAGRALEARQGAVRVVVRCSPHAVERCSGGMLLRVGGLELGKRRLTLRPGRRLRPRIVFSRRGRTYLLRRGAVRATLEYTSVDAAGVTTTTKKTYRVSR